MIEIFSKVLYLLKNDTQDKSKIKTNPDLLPETNVTSEPSHHVDSIFVKRVPVHDFWVMHQDFGLEGPLDGALFETLTWKSERI